MHLQPLVTLCAALCSFTLSDDKMVSDLILMLKVRYVDVPTDLPLTQLEICFAWMYGDHLLGDLAYVNPNRWSAWLSAWDVQQQLDNVASENRPVYVRVQADGVSEVCSWIVFFCVRLCHAC